MSDKEKLMPIIRYQNAVIDGYKTINKECAKVIRQVKKIFEDVSIDKDSKDYKSVQAIADKLNRVVFVLESDLTMNPKETMVRCKKYENDR